MTATNGAALRGGLAAKDPDFRAEVTLTRNIAKFIYRIMGLEQRDVDTCDQHELLHNLTLIR
ncbi:MULTISPECIES: hypothetical protein [unclassified Glutamicibacter]|uniref:hypothetical protein n=1 Tax=unclassified Glutamicibacter TaxID=2627139 RepID=UPI0021C69BCA|nr:hypothetical protein [Glutamicibacter sp. M10]UXN30862.1 hypothetical protein N6V40_10505 [Glutamicibacter sp. M10]